MEHLLIDLGKRNLYSLRISFTTEHVSVEKNEMGEEIANDDGDYIVN